MLIDSGQTEWADRYDLECTCVEGFKALHSLSAGMLKSFEVNLEQLEGYCVVGKENKEECDADSTQRWEEF